MSKTDSLYTVEFNAGEKLTISSVSEVGGDTLTWSRLDDLICIHLLNGISQGEQFEIEINFTGKGYRKMVNTCPKEYGIWFNTMGNAKRIFSYYKIVYETALFKSAKFRYPIIPKFHHSITPFCTTSQYLIR